MKKPNKFWDFVNDGYVKIKIKEGQTLQWHRRGWNGEGYSWEGEKWEIEDGLLINEYCRGGRDCDGSHRNGGVMVCPLDELAAVPSYGEPSILKPNWRKQDEWQRDSFAESMNY